jgi:hypothetical protein
MFAGIEDMRFSLTLLFSTLCAGMALSAPRCESFFSILESDKTLIPYAHFFKVKSQQKKSPHEFVRSRTQEIIRDIESRPAIPAKDLVAPASYKIKAKRNEVTKILYKQNLVEASEQSYKYQDKLILYKILEHYLDKVSLNKFHPVTKGLKEFLSEQGFFDNFGNIKTTREALVKALRTQFPNGFIVKPAIGFASDGKSFFKDMDEVADLLMQPKGSDLYKVEEFGKAFSHELGQAPVSGEKFIIQGLLNGIKNLTESSPIGSMNEYRVHSFYDNVINGATLSRWKIKADQTAVLRVNKFTQDFLNLLPKKFVNRQAWAFDVFEAPTGELTIIEINTNRGEKTNWSGFLKNPKVLGGYVRHLEQNYGWHFEGLSGWRLRNNLGNLQPAFNVLIEKYWSKTLNFVLEKIWKKPAFLINKEKIDEAVAEEVSENN